MEENEQKQCDHRWTELICVYYADGFPRIGCMECGQIRVQKWVIDKDDKVKIINEKPEHDEIVRRSVQALCDELIKYYPDILSKSLFLKRMEMILDIELSKVGYGDQEEI